MARLINAVKDDSATAICMALLTCAVAGYTGSFAWFVFQYSDLFR